MEQAPGALDPLGWLREQCSAYDFAVTGVYRPVPDPGHGWPVRADGPDELRALLEVRGQLLPLPKEPAALANVLEVGIVDHLIAIAEQVPGAIARRGTERGYPDLELDGPVFGGVPHAVDIKVARRAATRTASRTESRITLCTGNTYFKWPRPALAGDVPPVRRLRQPHRRAGHLHPRGGQHRAGARYRADRAGDLADRQPQAVLDDPGVRGAVDLISDLRDGRGEFATQDEFHKFWRAFPFKTSSQVHMQLQRLLDRQQDELDLLRAPAGAPPRIGPAVQPLPFDQGA